MTSEERADAATAAAMVALCAVAAGLEGGVEHRYGGAALALVGLAGAGWAWFRGFERPGKLASVGFGLVAGAFTLLALPWPRALRALLAPGQSRWFDLAEPEGVSQMEAWLRAMATYDVEAAVGLAGDWAWRPEVGAFGAHLGATDGWGLAWGAALYGGCAILFAIGSGLGRSRAACLVFALGFLVVGVGEALFGLANRHGPSTGLSEKVHYLGSATGTFINRTQFGVFLALAIGMGWGLAGSIFPLLPDEVRRHAKRRRRSSQPPGVLDGSGDKLPRLTLLAFVVALLVVAVVASQSRGALVGLVVAGIAVGGWTWARRGDATHLGLGLALPCLGMGTAILAFGPRGALGRFATLLGEDVSRTSRWQTWQEGMAAWLDAPVLGWGPGGWARAHPLHEAGVHLFSWDHAHNEPLQWLVEVGVVGFAGLLLLGVAWLRVLRQRLDLVEHDLRSSVGVGAIVGVLAVLLDSLGDFPTRAPGVALPAALLAGVAVGALSDAPGPRFRFGGIALAGVVAALGVATAARDLAMPGTRQERLSDQSQVYWARDAKTAGEAQTWRDDALAAIRAVPVDPSAHLALARAETKLAFAGHRSGGAVDEHILAADLAVMRTLTLRPRDPRLQVVAGATLSRLAEVSVAPDAFRERATRLLMAAVAADAWRAEDAFRVADPLGADALARIAGAAADTPFAQSRTLYQYGRALERRKRQDEALAVHARAAEADPGYGPPGFAAGMIARARGDVPASERWFRRFLQATEKPEAMEGWAQHFLGNEPAAETRLRRAVFEMPKNAWAWHGLAEVSRAQGDARAECEALQKVVHLDAKNTAASARYDEVCGGVRPG